MRSVSLDHVVTSHDVAADSLAGQDRADACKAVTAFAPESPHWRHSKRWVRTSDVPVQRRVKHPVRAQDPIYLRIFKVLLFVIQPEITGPLYVRLAFHDSATYNKNITNKGGCVPVRTLFCTFRRAWQQLPSCTHTTQWCV